MAIVDFTDVEVVELSVEAMFARHHSGRHPRRRPSRMVGVMTPSELPRIVRGYAHDLLHATSSVLALAWPVCYSRH